MYTFKIGAGTAKLQIAYQATWGDFDQYVGVGKIPTTTSYTYANTTGYNQACISVDNPPAGVYYYMVWALYSGHYKTQYTTSSSRALVAGDGLTACQQVSKAQLLLWQRVTKNRVHNKL